MKKFLVIQRQSQLETITARQPFARAQEKHRAKRGEYKRKAKFGNNWE